MPLSLRFDRGTLVLDGARAPSLAGVIWDPRTQNHRASAHRYASLRSAVLASGEALLDPLRERWKTRIQGWLPVDLRPYQRDALAAWVGQRHRGVVVLPTGAGKTRIALAAAASVRAPTAILCPTRVLLAQWMAALAEHYRGPIGCVGDGHSRVEDVTVFTFESAFRKMDGLGDRFALLVVDEAHHFETGMRGEALESSVAPCRLGLTATAPEPGGAGEETLAELIGPVVFALSIGDLSGSHLATFEVVRLRVALTPEERAEYQRLARPFLELRDGLTRLHPMLSWEHTLRAMSCTPAGKQAIGGWHRATALASFPAQKRALGGSLIARHRADKTLVFAERAADARTLSCDHLVPAITAEIGREEREAVLSRFRSGEVRCIVSARVLNEGVDVPDASVAVLLGGALGLREQIQRVGRVLRPSPGKRAIVYDVATEGTVDANKSDRKWRRLAAEALPTLPA